MTDSPRPPKPVSPGLYGSPAARCREPILNAPPATLAAVGLLIVVYGAMQLLPAARQDWVLTHLAFDPARLAAVLADPRPLPLIATLATLVSHALLHLDAIHLAVNAGFLLAFGSMCERLLGGRRFVLLLVVSAVCGALVQAASDWGDASLMLGASGAVSGAMGGLARLLWAGRRDPAGRRFAINFVLVLIGSNLLLAVFGGQLVGVDAEIAWQAHLGGLAAGFILAAPRRRRPPDRARAG